MDSSPHIPPTTATTTTTTVRSRSSQSHQSQSQSPSHSASASATSSLHKRKLPPSSDDNHHHNHHLIPPPFSDTRDDNDLESISARCTPDDSDSAIATAPDEDDDDDDEVDDDEEEEEFDNGDDRDIDDRDGDGSSIRDFTTARLDNSNNSNNSNANLSTANVSVRNSKMSKSGVVKVEPVESTKDGGGGGGMIAEGVKEDSVKSIFTENIQTSGAYSAREEGLKREEETGKLKFLCLSNDGIDEHMVWLIGLKNIFARQLPNMPKEYVVRLVMDRSHKSVMVIRRNQVVGGITYRPYSSQKFGEIAFCAITADEQVKGYGTRLMNHLKQHARDVDGLTHFLTYADNNAVGYFIKQGFTKAITLEKDIWHGYIKDYDGGILMECKIDPKLPYTNLSSMIHRQRLAIDEKIRELSNCHTIYPGIDFQKKDVGVPRKVVKVDDIPGLREAGWTPDQYGHSRFKQLIVSGDGASYQKSLTAFMRSLVKLMHEHPDSWPFKEPVDVREVPDYYHIIKNPIDLKTMSKRVESEQYYVTFEMFVADVRRMFDNARTYNSPETIYYKCATRVETHFSNKVQSVMEASPKIQSQ